MRVPVSRCAPALLAALILALAPGCAISFLSRYERPAGPIERPHIVERLAPRDPDVPRCIERSAGEVYVSGDVWGYIFVVLGYVAASLTAGLVWGIIELVNVIIDACDRYPEYDEDDAEQAQEPLTSP